MRLWLEEHNFRHYRQACIGNIFGVAFEAGVFGHGHLSYSRRVSLYNTQLWGKCFSLYPEDGRHFPVPVDGCRCLDVEELIVSKTSSLLSQTGALVYLLLTDHRLATLLLQQQ